MASFMQWLMGVGTKRPADEEEDDPRLPPPAKKQKVSPTSTRAITLNPSDVLVVQSSSSDNGSSSVTLYSDMLEESINRDVVKTIISNVRAKGGRFIMLDPQNGMSVLQKEADVSKLVSLALHEKTSALAAFGDFDDHPSLDLSPEALAATAVDVAIEMDPTAIGGLAFQPALTSDQITKFLKRAKKLNRRRRTAKNLHKLLPELEDAEHAVHLFRNFFDEERVVGRVQGAGYIILLSRREIDLIMYAMLEDLPLHDLSELMPYRKYYSLQNKMDGRPIKTCFDVLKNHEEYVKTLKAKVEILFTTDSPSEEEDEDE